MFMNCASLRDTSSTSMSVAMSRSAATDANFDRFSVAMPSCPPSSIALLMSFTSIGLLSAISRDVWARFSSSCSDAFTVFATPVKLSSKSVADLNDA